MGRDALDPWGRIGRSIERDIGRAGMVIAVGLVLFGALVKTVADVIVRRHR